MLLKDLNHKNNLVRLFTAANIKKRLMTLTDEKQLSELDIRLLKGFYTSSRTELEKVRPDNKDLNRREDTTLKTETIPSDTERSITAIENREGLGLMPNSVKQMFPPKKNVGFVLRENELQTDRGLTSAPTNRPLTSSDKPELQGKKRTFADQKSLRETKSYHTRSKSAQNAVKESSLSAISQTLNSSDSSSSGSSDTSSSGDSSEGSGSGSSSSSDSDDLSVNGKRDAPGKPSRAHG